MTTLKKGDGLVLANGSQVIVIASVFKMHSYDPNYYCVPVVTEIEGIGSVEMPIDIRAIVEIWRGGVRIDVGLDVASAAGQAKSYSITVKPKRNDLYELPLFARLTP